MNCLLDTHTFLWTVFAPEQLSNKVLRIVEDPNNKVYVSIVSYWEISLKYALGKLTLTDVSPDTLPGIARQMDFETLNVNDETAATFYKLPIYKHKDPFDRLIVWQAINQNVILATKDKDLRVYRNLGLKTIW